MPSPCFPLWTANLSHRDQCPAKAAAGRFDHLLPVPLSPRVGKIHVLEALAFKEERKERGLERDHWRMGYSAESHWGKSKAKLPYCSQKWQLTNSLCSLILPRPQVLHLQGQDSIHPWMCPYLTQIQMSPTTGELASSFSSSTRCSALGLGTGPKSAVLHRGGKCSEK